MIMRRALALVLLLACGAGDTKSQPAPARDPVATMARIADLPDNDERRALVGSLRRSPADQVHPLLTAGFASPLANHRSAAAMVAGRRGDGQKFLAELLNAAADVDPIVRISAARALGSLRAADAFPALQHNLSHESVPVRLSALRALAHIDPDRAAAMPELAGLQLDPNPLVSSAATKVARKTLQ